jgi:hypothetical protein
MARTDPALASSNRWDKKLIKRGHRLRWRMVRPWPYARWRGVCTRCGGEIECGKGRATSAGYDIRRSGQCRPQAGRSLLRLIAGGR